jgi:hypothetical protein
MMDRWILPIKIKAGLNVVRVQRGADPVVSITIPPGTYYQGTGLPSGLASFMTAFNAAALAAIGDASVATAQTPAGQTSSILSNSSVRYVDGGAGWSFKFSDPLFTLDPRILGFPKGTATDTGTSPLPTISMLGSWQSFTQIDGVATSKSRLPERELYTSTSKTYASTRQHSVRDARSIRRMIYEYVPGLHVYESGVRAASGDYVETSGLSSGDSANAFEQVWRAGSNLDDIIIVHGEGSASWEDISSKPHEIVRFASMEQRSSFEECIELMLAGGEFYRISVDLLVKSSTYDY